MKRWLVVAAVLVAAASVASAARLDPDLARRLQAADNPNQKFAVNFTMQDQAEALTLDPNIPNLPKPQRRARVAEVLRDHATATQRGLMTYLKTQEAAGKVDGLNSLWLVNEVACFATRDVVYEAAARDEVADIYYDLIPVKIEIPKIVPKPAPRDGHEPNLDVTKAPAVWKMGYTGQGIVVGEVDTGIWYTHQDLRNHLWTSPAYPHCGFNYGSHILFPSGVNPSPNDTTDNIDYAIGHGTHCAGIVSADGTYGNGTHDTMGVAPSAKMLVCNSLVYFNSVPGETLLEQSMFLGFQFCVSPPRDPTNGCDVITTSLGLLTSNSPRYANYRLVERNIAAAGVSHAVAAGNEASAQTIRTPGNCPPPWPNPANNPTDTATSAVITVGATDNSDNAASFTSKGPTIIWGSTPPYNDYVYPPGLMDPDVSCPGVNILSTFWQGDQAYTTMSGTSMATPGTAGCIALMLSKNPNLTPRQVDSILEMTSHDLGTTGKDNTYGAGRINCSLAVAMTPLPNGVRLLSRTIDDAAPGGNADGIVNPGETVNLPTWVINMDPNVRNGVTGKIVKTDTSSLFAITDSLKTFGNIPANDSASTGANGFKITVAAFATNGNTLGMNLICKDATDSSWISGYSLTVGTPVLNYASIVVHDSPPGGNNNGILDPGESVTMEALVKNVGGGNGYNVMGYLASGDVRLTVADPDGIYGAVAHGATVGNTADRYTVTADGGIAPGTSIPCTLRLTADGGYAVTRQFTIRIGLPAVPGVVVATHDTGYCKLSLSAFGTLGYDMPVAPQQGEGFCFPKSGLTGMYYGGMLCGNGEDYMVDHYYGVPASSVQSDWSIEDSLRFYPPTRGDQMIIGSYTDAGHPAPKGLRTNQTSYQTAVPGYDKFVVVVYDYTNAGASPITGLYSGIMTDFDINTATVDEARTDATRRSAYMYETGNENPTMGLTLLEPTSAANLSAIDHDVYVYPTDTAMNESMKYRFLNGALHEDQSNRSYDWSVVVSAGPFDLGPGETHRVAYAVVGGSNTSDYLVNSDSAQSWYDHNLVGISEQPSSLRTPQYALHIAPNPFSKTTRISYMMPQPGRLSIKVFDASGRLTTTLFEDKVGAGIGAINWRPGNVAKGVYFVRACLNDDTVVQKVMLVQ
jgi:subtilisin family serine protease